MPDAYPISTWADCDAALAAATVAARELCDIAPKSTARFLETFASRIEARAADLVAIAHAETALAPSPRLAEVEVPRTTHQLR